MLSDPMRWSLPLGRLFGINIRVHILFPIVALGLVLRVAFQREPKPVEGAWADVAMIVGLLFIYPTIGANQLVGTDLTQAVPLTLAAALGALVFGHVEFGLTASLILGSVPAVFVGSLLSSTVPDRYVRPAIAFVIFASGLKYVGLNTTALGWTLCAVLLAAAMSQ